MGLRLKELNYGEFFFVTTTFINHKPWGNIPGVYDILGESLKFRLGVTDSKLVAYVFMPSHIHLILAINGKFLAQFMRDFKKFTAQKALVDLCATNKIWQQRYDRQVIISFDVMMTKIEYIHRNPVKAELVIKPEEWFWSSAKDYLFENNGPMPISKEWYN